MERLEISDLIVDYDEHTFERRPVVASQVAARLRQQGDRRAARIVETIPRRGEYLSEHAVDRMLIRAHAELQRLEEEFLHAHRMLDLIVAAIRALAAANVPRPWRVVDVGCGLGYVARWLTSQGGLGPDVEIVGVDFNAALVRSAQALADEEGLRCRFRVANAFSLETPAHVFLSSGVLHHFRGPALRQFFAAQDVSTTQCFIHVDIRASALAPLGSWLYHRARMREPLAINDGVVSAARAHRADVLLRAASEGAPNMHTALFESGPLKFMEVFHAIVGYRHGLGVPLDSAMQACGLRGLP